MCTHSTHTYTHTCAHTHAHVLPFSKGKQCQLMNWKHRRPLARPSAQWCQHSEEDQAKNNATRENCVQAKRTSTRWTATEVSGKTSPSKAFLRQVKMATSSCSISRSLHPARETELTSTEPGIAFAEWKLCARSGPESAGGPAASPLCFLGALNCQVTSLTICWSPVGGGRGPETPRRVRGPVFQCRHPEDSSFSCHLAANTWENIPQAAEETPGQPTEPRGRKMIVIVLSC